MKTATEKQRTGKTIEVLPAGHHAKFIRIDQGNKYYFEPNTPVKKKKKHGIKPTSDYIDCAIATAEGNALLWHSKTPQLGFYIILSINSGMRFSDAMRCTFGDFTGKATGDYLSIVEQKTGKRREIQLNDNIIQSFAHLVNRYKAGRARIQPEQPIFISQKGMIYANSTINRALKKVFKGVAPNISAHSLRKAFGRRVYEMAGKNEHSLVLLSQIFGHSNIGITRRYLGLRKQEISNIYLNL